MSPVPPVQPLPSSPTANMDTAISRCLANGDIVPYIAEELPNLRSMAALAQTSSTLYDYVNPMLWRHLYSLVPLLRLLPPDTWTECESSSISKVFVSPYCTHFIRSKFRYPFAHQELTTSANIDWTRFALHAHHVRDLTLRPRNDISTCTLINLLNAKPPNKPLLPNLRTLSICENNIHQFPKLSLLLSPSLLELYVSWPMDHCPEDFLQAISSNCPDIQKMSLCLSVESPYTGSGDYQVQNITETTQDLLSRCIMRLTRLQSFHCLIPPSTSTFRALATHPSLQELVVRLPNNALHDIVEDLREGWNTSWFPALSSFGIIADDLNDDVNALLASFTNPTLEAIGVRTDVLPSTDDVRQLAEAIASSAYASTLTDLSLYFATVHPRYSPFQDEESDVPIIDAAQALKPLLRRPGPLRLLHLRSAAVAASDEDISTISSAYPSLRSLAIWSEQGGQHVRHPSLHSLLTIAQKCPGLTDLRLNLDRIQTACIPSTADVDRFLPFPSKHPLAGLLTDRSFLTGLDLKTVEGAEPRALELANLISRIFPVHKLGIVRHGYFPEREMLCDPWRDSRVVWCVQSPVDPFWLA